MPFPRLQVTVLVPVLLAVCAAAIPAAEEPPVTEAFDASALAATARNSVVVLHQYGRDGKKAGVGTGFVASADGLVATCFHVIGEGRPIRVELADGKAFDVTEVFASDRRLDLAVVRIGATNLPRLRLGDSTALKQGAPVVAIGNPIGLERSVVQGVVSAKRELDGIELIQLAIPVEPGNSGGPILDSRGRVQGLLNMRSAVTANLGFAVPVNALKTLIERPNPVPMGRWLTLDSLPAAEWKPIMGAQWSRKAGRIQVEGMGEGFGGRSICLWQKAVPPLPYELSVTVKLEDESGAAGLIFASDGADRHYGFYPTAGQMRFTRFDGPDVFSWRILREFKTAHYKPGDWNSIRVRVETNRIAGYVNGQLVLEFNEAVRSDGAVGLAKFRNTKAQFKNFRAGAHSLEPEADSESKAFLAASRELEEASGRIDSELIARVKSNGEAGRSALLDHARKLENDAGHLREVAAALHDQLVTSELTSVLSAPETQVDLFHAALLVAKLDNADLDLPAYRTELKSMADELREQIGPSASDSDKVAALAKFLFRDRGFHGCRTDYYNPSNSYLNEVLDHREGLPITLAVLYLELAGQIGLTNVAGLPLPTHFMVRFQPDNQTEQIIDVFDAGKVLTRTQAVELVIDNVERMTTKDFEPATKRQIITRMLRNLLSNAERNRNPRDALRYLKLIVALNPEAAETDRP